jgi:hypothetical protein
MVDLLADYAQPGPMSAGRNDPCPCGSGRKHKVCCAVRGGWSLADRMPWVMRKLMSFYGSPSARDVVMEVAHACGLAEESNYRDVAALNLALFEGGVIDDLCELRGVLLPADELALLRDWARVRGQLYELVERAGEGAGVLLNLRTGERHEIVDHSLTSAAEPGDAMLAWLVPGPDGTWTPFYGAVMVADVHREGLLDLLDEDPEATTLGTWVRDLHAPPRIATTDGDPLVSIEQTYEVDDPEAARAALAAHLEGDEQEEGTLRAFEERDGTRWLQGTVRLADDRLTVETMSAPRAARFADLIADVVPDARLVDEHRLPIGELPARDAEADPDDESFLDTLSEEDRAEAEQQLETFMRQYEDAWVDTPLQLLDGRTPRQALEDPTRRDALLRLLDEIQATEDTWTGHGRGMSAARLRTLLGL